MFAISLQWQFCNSIYINKLIFTIAKLWCDCTTMRPLLLTLCLALHGVPGQAPFPLPASPSFFQPWLPEAHHDSSSTLARVGGGTLLPQLLHLHGWKPDFPSEQRQNVCGAGGTCRWHKAIGSSEGCLPQPGVVERKRGPCTPIWFVSSRSFLRTNRTVSSHFKSVQTSQTLLHSSQKGTS